MYQSSSSKPKLNINNNSTTITANPTTTLNPLLFATPLNFKPASTSTTLSTGFDNHIPKSYIVLSNNSNNSSMKTSKKLGKSNTKKTTNDPPKPKSLNEAIASYTGNKYLTHKERKRKRKSQEIINEDKQVPKEDQQEQGEDEEEEETDEAKHVTKKVKRGMWDSIKSFWLGTPNSTPTPPTEEEEEDLGENIEEKQDEEDEEEEEENEDDDSSSSGEVLTETSPFTGFSEPEKSEIDEEDEEDDADFVDEESGSPESGDEDEENVESDSVSPQASDDDDEDEDLEKLKYDLKIDQLVNNKDVNEDEEDEEEEEEEEEETQERTSTTPPTSPEEDTEKQQPEPLEVSYYDINEYEDDRGSNNSTRIYKNWRELANKKPPVGLLNHGVTCYMNSAIQSIIHIPAMQHYLNDVNDNKYSQLKPRSVTHVLAELSKRMWLASNTNNNKKGKSNGGIKYINPKKIIQRLDEINCMMSEWQQEDSHEYYMSLISRLQEDSTPKGKKLNESIIYDIFGGLLNQRITCHKCHNVSITKQEFYDLSLGLNKKKIKSNNNGDNITNDSNNDTTSTTATSTSTSDPIFNSNKFSVEKSINDFFSNEVIKKLENDSKSGYFCEKCNRFTHANKISSIEIAPETLTIHFKRFKFNNNSSSKVKQLINYSKYLDLSKYMVQGTAKYRLTSVIVHEGRSISSGHYVAHCLQPDGYTWCTYDDEYINKIEERVALNDPSAYVLVYTKLTPKV